MSAHPKPSLRELTAELRELHSSWSHPDAGGEFVCMARVIYGDGGSPTWELVIDDRTWITSAGREFIPGDGARFDAVAAARRLLAAVRDRESGQ